MKKLVSLLTVVFAIIFMANNVQAQETQTIDFNAKVLPYIQVNPDFFTMEFNETLNPDPTVDGDAVIDDMFNHRGHFYDVAYSNCEMNISVDGQNPAGDGEPILARQEDGKSTFDRLQTVVDLRYYVNGDLPHYSDKFRFVSGKEGDNVGSWTYGKSADYPTPHDGEVDLVVNYSAGLPHISPDFGTNNTWNQSADAGDYTATVTVTFSVL